MSLPHARGGDWPKEALANLDRFDEDWWLDAMRHVHHYLSFGLRFD
jgi:hypothetical protein